MDEIRRSLRSFLACKFLDSIPDGFHKRSWLFDESIEIVPSTFGSPVSYETQNPKHA